MVKVPPHNRRRPPLEDPHHGPLKPLLSFPRPCMSCETPPLFRDLFPGHADQYSIPVHGALHVACRHEDVPLVDLVVVGSDKAVTITVPRQGAGDDVLAPRKRVMARLTRWMTSSPSNSSRNRCKLRLSSLSKSRWRTTSRKVKLLASRKAMKSRTAFFLTLRKQALSPSDMIPACRAGSRRERQKLRKNAKPTAETQFLTPPG